MPRYDNGSIIGVDNIPTRSVGGGIWDINAVHLAVDGLRWPGTVGPIDLSGATINNGGSWNQGGATSTLFDGTLHVTVTSCVRSPNSSSQEMHLLLAEAKDIDELRLYGPSDAGMHEASSTSITFTIYKDASSFGTGGTLAGTLSNEDVSANNDSAIISGLGDGTDVTRYTIVWSGGSSGDKYACAEIEADGN